MHRIEVLVSIILTTLAWTGCSATSGQQEPLDVSYIANEGFMIENDSGKVLIDAMFCDETIDYCDIPPAELRERMARHGNVMSNLVKAVVLLDRPTIKLLAQRIADEEVIARLEAKGSKNVESRLPKDFFAEQDALRAAARDLATSVVSAATDSVLADRFAAVAHTCVACHSVYLRGPAQLAK